MSDWTAGNLKGTDQRHKMWSTPSCVGRDRSHLAQKVRIEEAPKSESGPVGAALFADIVVTSHVAGLLRIALACREACDPRRIRRDLADQALDALAALQVLSTELGRAVAIALLRAGRAEHGF